MRDWSEEVQWTADNALNAVQEPADWSWLCML